MIIVQPMGNIKVFHEIFMDKQEMKHARKPPESVTNGPAASVILFKSTDY